MKEKKLKAKTKTKKWLAMLIYFLLVLFLFRFSPHFSNLNGTRVVTWSSHFPHLLLYVISATCLRRSIDYT